MMYLEQCSTRIPVAGEKTYKDMIGERMKIHVERIVTDDKLAARLNELMRDLGLRLGEIQIIYCAEPGAGVIFRIVYCVP